MRKLALRLSLSLVQFGAAVALMLFGSQASPAGALQVTAISAGAGHTCLIAAGGLVCWGDNSDGQLGNGTMISSTTPQGVPDLTSGVIAVSAGLAHTCAVTDVGGVLCWGKNLSGQLGDGTFVDSSSPVQVTGLASGVVDVSVGSQHTCALTETGGVKCWGQATFGALGDGLNCGLSYCLTPTDVTGLESGVSAISAGDRHTCAVTKAGGAKCWGHGQLGQLGNGTKESWSTTPIDVLGLTSGVSVVSAGYRHTCAVTTAGGVKCWGENEYGKLGDGTTTITGTPVDVVGLASGASAVIAAYLHTCALTDAGGVECWGYNGPMGLLGDGLACGAIACLSPVDVFDLSSGAIALDAGSFHTCVAMVSGDAQCWGFVGAENGKSISTSIPLRVAGKGAIDSDGDGCLDQQENGPDETIGGLRDFANPWDFYDVVGPNGGPPDGVVDLPNDVLGVLQHISPAGQAPYDERFDRGPSLGPHPWNMSAPDGVIDLPNDVLGVVAQFGHSCQQPA